MAMAELMEEAQPNVDNLRTEYENNNAAAALAPIRSLQNNEQNISSSSFSLKRSIFPKKEKQVRLRVLLAVTVPFYNF